MIAATDLVRDEALLNLLSHSFKPVCPQMCYHAVEHFFPENVAYRLHLSTPKLRKSSLDQSSEKWH